MDAPTILYVDDDKENLRTFKRLFRKQYNVLLAESGEEGLQIIHLHSPIPLIISDQRMPEMTGIEFLEKTIKISPDSIRMIITGFTDVQALIDAINTGRVYRYITKPWDVQELYVTFKRAVESYDLKKKNNQLLIDLQRKNEDLERSYKTLQETQEKLIQSEKLASIGRLASRIAHELRNPIQVIRMGLDVLNEDLREEQRCAMTLEHLDQEIIALNTIIQDLLEYARDMKFEYTPTDINSLIQGVFYNLADKIEEKQISVNTSLEDIGLISADGIRIRQVILNLVQNAIEAMQEGGTLEITTRSQDDETVSISIQDTGCGMSPEQQQRIFEPFFTTKEKGVGLGMSIVHKIIEVHGGTIQIESQEGVGTIFTVDLPRKEQNDNL
jgi:signal transduction histidine kinase